MRGFANPFWHVVNLKQYKDNILNVWPHMFELDGSIKSSWDRGNTKTVKVVECSKNTFLDDFSKQLYW